MFLEQVTNFHIVKKASFWGFASENRLSVSHLVQTRKIVFYSEFFAAISRSLMEELKFQYPNTFGDDDDNELPSCKARMSFPLVSRSTF
jgi:hypothetical protein